ncbi:MAG: hypothetical protein ABGX47_12235 [Martelella sp.]|uniref:hypothetical protein n=1 Tax=Martelella sp. TaxID=1969699 RepID=UPI003241CCFF
MALIADHHQRDDEAHGNVIAAARVQGMAPLHRALLSREALIRAAGGTVAFGPAEKRLRRILSLTGRGGMVAIDLILLLNRYIAGRKLEGCANVPDAVFIGIGAMRESQLREEIAEQLGRAPHFIDQRRPDGFAGLPAPGLLGVLRHWTHVMRAAFSILSAPDPDFKPPDLRSTLTMRVHELAYLLAWFEELREARPDILVFCSTADLPAHAACLAGFSVEYHQHGFLSSSLVFPQFTRMVALTTVEGQHVAKRIPGLQVTLRAHPSPVDQASAVLVFAGDRQARDPAPITSLTDKARENGLNVVVRPHPNGHRELWSELLNRDGVIFDAEGSFEEFLQKWRPAFVASWFSTTLLDGLVSGAIPITLSRDNSAVLLPINAIALSWPDQETRVEVCMRSKDERLRAHARLMEVLRP